MEQWYRHYLMGVAAVVFVATPIELVLLGHFGTWNQWIPFVACAVGLLATLQAYMRPSENSFRVARGVSMAIGACALLGSFFHFETNMALELEIRPNASWSTVLIETMEGSAPVIATGILIVGALLLWAACRPSSSATD